MKILTQNQGYNVSNKYQVINTNEVVEKLLKQGFEVNRTVVNRTRKKEKDGFQKHRVILTHPQFKKNSLETRPELVLTNSYDATSSMRLDLGFYRLICSNGLMVGRNVLGDSIKHIGNTDQKLSELLDNFPKKIREYNEYILTASKIKPSLHQSYDLLDTYLRFQFGDKDIKLPQGLASISRIRRLGDEGQDLWTFFNRVQETALRGGLRYINENGKMQTTRAIKSIHRQDQINTKLFEKLIQFTKAA